MRLMVMIRSVVGKVLRFLGLQKDFRSVLLSKMPRHAVCAEIGVWKGDFSDRILRLTNPSRLHLIDPWAFQAEFSERMYGGAVAKDQGDMDDIYKRVAERFEGYPNVVLERGKSEPVLTGFPDQYFDWVYIDGNHYYEFVLKDLELCFAKVKKGGVISGDDYTWGEKDGFPVKAAVDDFLARYGLEDNLTIIGSQFMIEL